MTTQGHIYRDTWFSGQRCYCHNLTDADIALRAQELERRTLGVKNPPKPDFREPAYALGRFTESKLLPGYGQASGLRCFMYATAAVYAPTREAADAIADAHDLRGPRANAYHAELSS